MKDLTPFVPPKVSKSGGSAIDPFDGRYFDEEISRYLGEQVRITYQAYVEAALAHTLAEFGVCSEQNALEIEKSARNVTLDAVEKEERTTKHDVKALVSVIKAGVSDNAKPFVHLTATSYDIVSTAMSIQYRNVIQDVVIPRLRALIKTLSKKADTYAETVQIGRTHGQHGVPITFGFALAEYIERFGQSMEVLDITSQKLPGKVSGAVGAYNASLLFFEDPLEFEKSLLKKVGLDPAAHSTQIVPPEPLIRLFDELTNLAGSLANLAHDMRHLQRSEIAEVREAFDARQTGSSTMAHKRNPISFENIASQFKQVLGQLMSAKLNLVSEHQRDLTDSASARFYPVLVASVANMIVRLEKAMANIEVDDEAMVRNLRLSEGAIAAEPLYLLLAKFGHPSAHEAAKAVAHKAIDEKKTFVSAVKDDPKLQPYWSQFSAQEKKIITEPERYYTGLAAKKTRSVIKRWKANK